MIEKIPYLNNVVCGDCLELMRDIPDKSVDMILCDLPYGTTKCSWDILIPFDKLWDHYNRIITNEAAIVLFGSEPFSSYLRLSNIKMFKYDWVWKKSKGGSAFTAKYRPVNKHEMVSVFGKGKIKYFPQMTEGKPYTRSRNPHNKNNHKVGFNKNSVHSKNLGFRHPITVQEFQQKWRRQDQLHPTQKPIDLCEYLIKTYTNEGDLVLDNCCGSGSTLVAAQRLNRKFIGMDISEEYCKIARERILSNE